MNDHYPFDSLSCLCVRHNLPHSALVSFLSFKPDQGNSTSIMPSDCMGNIPTYKQWEELKTSVDSYYKKTAPEIIEANNAESCPDCQRTVRLQEKPAKPSKQGFIYLARDEKTDFIKIGFSTKPEVRERTLQSEKPTITFLATFPGTLKEEKALHAEFSEYRIRGEWFCLALEDIESIQERFTNRQPKI